MNDGPAAAALSRRHPLSFGHRLRWRSAPTAAGAVLGVLLLASALMRFGFLGHPYASSLNDALASPSLAHPFGTDDLGRNVLVRTLYATLTDLGVALLASGVPALLGLAIGAVAGYAGGWLDGATTRVVDFLLAFPLMVLAICVIAVVGPGLGGVCLALAVKGLPGYIRLTRGQMLVVREQQFIMCAETLGLSRRRILGYHALPHVVRPLIVYAVFDITGNFLLLASLSYLGLGVQPPGAEWGAIMAQGQPYLFSAWWIVVLPGILVVLVGISITVLGEALAERLRLSGVFQ